MRPNICRQVMPICHYVFMDEETLIQLPKKAGGVGGYVLELCWVVMAVLLFSQHWGMTLYSFRHTSCQVPCWGQKHILVTQLCQVQGTAKQLHSPWTNPRVVLRLPSESILENCHLSRLCCRSSICHLPLKFLEVFWTFSLDVMVTCRIIFYNTT